MLNTTNTIQRAKSEIRAVLRRYRLSWAEVAPDVDEKIWRQVRPTAKKVRKELFSRLYPSLQ